MGLFDPPQGYFGPSSIWLNLMVKSPEQAWKFYIVAIPKNFSLQLANKFVTDVLKVFKQLVYLALCLEMNRLFLE